MLDVKTITEHVGTAIESLGVLVVLLGAIFATGRFLQRRGGLTKYRQEFGHSLLLGLEFMVAGDIIRTVAVDPSLESVAVLGLIVLIRSFLSFSLEVELEGRWPWQQRPPARPEERGDSASNG